MTLKRHLIVIAFFCGLALLALHQPVFHSATHLTGFADGSNTSDYFHTHWNFWWVRHALASGHSIYQTDYVFAPHTSSLAFHTLAVFWYPLWALLEPAVGTVAAMTAVFIVAYTLTGYSFYLLLRREGVAGGLALVGGALFELTPALANAVFWSNINLLGWFWLPVLLLLWGRLNDAVLAYQQGEVDGRMRHASSLRLSQSANSFQLEKLFVTRHSLLFTLSLALALWGMILTDLQYPLFAAFLIVPYALLIVYRAPTYGMRARLLLCGLLAVGLALALLWFIGPLRAVLAYDRAGLVSTPAERAVKIPFPEGYLSHATRDISLGAVLLPLVIVSIILAWRYRQRLATAGLAVQQYDENDARRRHASSLQTSHIDSQFQSGEVLTSPFNHQPLTINRWFWLALAVPPLILSAGASITIAGTEITLPYVWLHNLLGGQFRYPERFVPVFLIPAVLFVMLTLTRLVTQRGWRVTLVCGLLLVIMADARLYRSISLQPMPTQYDFYEAMGREPYDYVMVEVPTGASTGESLVGEQRFAALQWYGIFHGKRMVNGHLSRADVNHFYAMRTDDPLLSWLGQRRFLEPELVEPELRRIINEWPVGYIVVHQDMIGLNGPTTQEIIGYLNGLPELVCPVWVERDVVVYRTTWHPGGCPARTPTEVEPGVYRVDIGTEGDERFIGWGWHWPEIVGGATTWRWTGEYPQTQLYVDLPAGAYTVRLAAQAFWEARRLGLLVNDVALNCADEACLVPTVLPDTLQTVTFNLPAEVVGEGKHLRLTIDYDGVIVPQAVGQSADERKLAVAVDWVEFSRNP